MVREERRANNISDDKTVLLEIIFGDNALSRNACSSPDFPVSVSTVAGN
jgi:hypothetical protein